MPVLRVDWYKGRTQEQKIELSKRITKAFQEIAQIPAEEVHIVFNDVEKSNWVRGGELSG